MTDPVRPRRLSGSSNTIGLRNRSKRDGWLDTPVFFHYSEQEARWKMPGPHTTYTCHGTHIGHTRRINEDALFVNEAEGLWLVADGLAVMAMVTKRARQSWNMWRVTAEGIQLRIA